MIVDHLINLVTYVVTVMLGWLPSFTLPLWWSTAMTSWSTIVTGISDLAHWVPLQAVFNVAIAVFLVSAFAFVLRVGRIVLSLVTGGGGGAA